MHRRQIKIPEAYRVITPTTTTTVAKIYKKLPKNVSKKGRHMDSKLLPSHATDHNEKLFIFSHLRFVAALQGLERTTDSFIN